METESFFAIAAGIWAVMTFVINRRVEKIKTLRAYNKELQIWSDSVIDIMTTCEHLCNLNPEKDLSFYDKRHNLLIQLSSFVDKGRFFLPNKEADKYSDKPSAYRGFRSAALNHIVTCYSVVNKLDYKNYILNKEKKILITNAKREFVSEIHIKLNPVKLEKEIRRIF